MEKYNYRGVLAEDIRTYIQDNEISRDDYEDMDAMHEALYDALWVEDSVTGNGSGSYTFNAWEAEENLCHNMDLLEEALSEFGWGIDYLSRGAEACDVTIRCYLLGEVLTQVLSDDFLAWWEK